MKFLRTALIGSILTFSTVPIAYFIRLGYARGLSVEAYGLFYAILSTLMLVNLIATLGVRPALGHLIPKYEGSARANQIIAAAGNVRTVGVITAAVLLFVLAPWLEHAFFNVEGATLALRIMTGWFIAHQIATLTTGIFLGYRVVWAYAGYDLYRQLFVLIVSATAAVFFALDLVAVAIIWAATHATTTLAYLVALRIVLPQVKRVRPDLAAYREMFSYSIPTLFVAGASIVMSQIDTIMITAIRTIEEVAAYNVAYPTAQLLLVLAIPVVMTILPEVSSLYHKKRHEEAFELVRSIIRTISSASVLGIVLLSTLAYPALAILFSEQLATAWPALTILAFGLAANGLASINLQVLGAIGEVKRRAVVMNSAVALNVLLNLVLIYLYGYVGAAIATTITYVALLGISVRELRQRGFETLTSSMVWKLGIPALASAALVIGLSTILQGPIVTIVVAGGVGTAAFALLAILTRGILIEDLLTITGEIQQLLRTR